MYDASAAGANTFEFDAGLAGSDGLPVTIAGGWDPTFTTRSDDPVASALSGGVSARVLHIKAEAAGAAANVTLELLGILDGRTTAASSPGAGILATQSSGGAVTLTVNRCVFHGNIAENNSGGAIAAQGPITVIDSRFTYNRADTGGAVYLWATSTPALFTGCEFSDNSIGNPNNPARLYGWQGSTIFSSSPDLTVEGCEFSGMSDGSTSGSGSTIYLHTGGHLTARNSSFRDINILYWGSAIQLWDAGASISGCLFANNRAGGPPVGSGYAAVTYLNNSGAAETTSIVNSTFVGNRSDWDYAGDVHFRGGNLTVRNSIFFDNSSSGIRCEAGCAGSVDYSSVEGGAAAVSGAAYGANNSAADPLFVAADPDYHLQAASPCVDAGSNAAVPAVLEEDFEGDPRIFALKDRDVLLADMGWDEYYDGVLEFTAPTAGTFWLNDGSTRTITWTCQNIGGDVRLYVWQGDRWTGHEVTEIAASVPCSDADVRLGPAGAPGGDGLRDRHGLAALPDGRPRHRPADHLAPEGDCPPTAGRPSRRARRTTITWQSGNLPGATIAIQLYSGLSPSRSIAVAAPNTGTFSWKVPYTQAPGAAYRIRVSATSPNVSEDWSDAAFRILPAVTLTAPNGGQRWKRGLAYKVTWTYRNAPGPTVRLDLYKGAALSRTIVASTPVGTAGKGSYLWRIPATQTPAGTYTIKVRSTKYPNCFDFSNKAFTITK